MKNITLSADENLIEEARLIAKAQRRTLNAAISGVAGAVYWASGERAGI